jgi:sensor histidine kinase YesM
MQQIQSPSSITTPSKWQPVKEAFHDYATWLVSISWWLFAGVSIVVMTAAGMLLVPQAGILLVLTSIVVKFSYKQQIQAEAKATAATYLAEAEQLKSQLMQAKMAAMQAQVEPHFLFNTLASIDHLIETDPPRASLMQKSLIALLRATLPSMRETSANSLRHLGQELAVIRPYLDIQKMRMEDRLQIQWDIPDGLQSAELPSMMMLSLVENAFKHGLEPQAQGGTLTLRAEVIHGKLVVTVKDTGVGYFPAEAQIEPPKAFGGFGLNNIRERLKLIYGEHAQFKIRALEAYEGTGTLAIISLPYRVAPSEV